MMYVIRENIINDKTEGYFIDEKIKGKILDSIYVTFNPCSCSCSNFALSKNPYTHFHINLVKYWINAGKPKAAMYAKSKAGKIVVLCPGFV